MSIDRTHSLSGVSPIQPREASEIQQQKRKEAASQPAVDGAQVKLSDAQSRLMQPNGQDINVERVEALKLAIRNGETEHGYRKNCRRAVAGYPRFTEIKRLTGSHLCPER